MNKLILLIFSIYLFGIQSTYASSMAIPLKDKLRPPASDLVHKGKVIDKDRAFELAADGFDISELNPRESQIWKNNSDSFVHHSFPAENSTFAFHSYKSKIRGMFRASLNGTIGGGVKPYTLVMSLDSHGALIRAALLKKLGFQMVGPKYYKTLKIKFDSVDDKDSFLDHVSDATLTARTRWISSFSEETLVLTIQDVLLEPAKVDFQQYYWGAMHASHLRGRRAIRSLLVPFVLADIGESLNLFSWELGKIVSKNIILTHPYADAFNEITFSDGRWIARKIARLSREDFIEIAEYASYPSDVSTILVEKLISRRNHLVKLFKLKGRINRKKFSPMTYNPKLNVGSVEKGKITKEYYDGYAIRFTYGDPESPLRASELSRYLLIKGINTALKSAESYINSFAEYSVKQGMDKHQQKMFEEFIRAVQAGEPYSMPMKAWATPIGGIGLNVSRDVVSGTYYGSESKIQLVDTFSLSGNVGLFLGFDAVPVVTPGVTGNIGVSRSYVHLRPLLDMKSALKESWKSLFIKGHLSKIAKLLEVDLGCEGTDCKVAEKTKKALADFAENFNPGEMVIIADSLNMNGGGQVSVPLEVIFGPIGKFVRITVGAGASKMLMKRVTLERTDNGISVYVQKMNTNSANLSFDFSFFIKLYGGQSTRKNGKADTDFYQIPIEDVPEKDRVKTVLALKGLFKKNNTELLEENFYPYVLDHKLKSKIGNNKFMLWHWDKMNMSHVLKVKPPMSEEHNYNPDDHQRTLYRRRKINRTGNSITKYLGEIIGGLQKWVKFDSGRPGEDVATSLWGRGFKEIVSTEAEITKGTTLDPVSVIENIWSGWSIRKKRFFRIVKKLQKRFTGLSLERDLIAEDAFNDTKKIQLYELRTTTILYKEALKRITDILLEASELSAYNAMIFYYGKEDFISYCESAVNNDSDGGREQYYGEQNYQCVMPWMQKILKLREKFKEGKIKGLRGRVDLINELVYQLFHNARWDNLINYLGRDNIFMVVKIGGFRTNDENEDAEYMSDTIGLFDNDRGSGIFRDFAGKHGMSNYEVNASFFTEGM